MYRQHIKRGRNKHGSNGNCIIIEQDTRPKEATFFFNLSSKTITQTINKTNQTKTESKIYNTLTYKTITTQLRNYKQQPKQI